MRNMVQGLTSHERPMPPQGLHVAQHDFAAVSTIQESPVPSDFAVARLDQLAQMPSSATGLVSGQKTDSLSKLWDPSLLRAGPFAL